MTGPCGRVEAPTQAPAEVVWGCSEHQNLLDLPAF